MQVSAPVKTIALMLMLVAMAALSQRSSSDTELDQALQGAWCNSDDGGKSCWGYDIFDKGKSRFCGRIPENGQVSAGTSTYSVDGTRVCHVVTSVGGDSKKSFSLARMMTGLGARAARKSSWSRPRASARGGHCSVSAGSSFSRLRRKVVTKQDGAAMVQRCSTPQSQVVIVPPPELPVTPTCCGSTSVRRQQVVQRADAVPGPPRAEELADQELLVAGVQVFAHADADAAT